MYKLLDNPALLLAINEMVILYLYSYIQRTFFEKKTWAKEHPMMVKAIYVLDWALFFGLNILGIVWVNMLISIAVFFIPLFICYKANNARGILYFVFFLFSTLVIELIMGLILGKVNHDVGFNVSYEHITSLAMAPVNMAEIIACILICYFGNKDKDKRLNKLSLIYMIIPVTSIIVITFFCVIDVINSEDPRNVSRYAAMVLIILFFNIFIFVILENHTNVMKRDFALKMNEMKLRSDAEVMEVAAANMKERLILAENAMDQDRTLRHDRRHFEALLLTLAKEGKFEEVQRYLEERIAIEPKAEKVFCDNATVNAAITHYVSIATAKNIKITISANIPSKLEVDEMGLAITISNLLENAIHAAEKLPEDKRFIEITAKYKKQLILEIVNSCEKKATLDEDGYPVTSEEGHGTGTRSVLAFINQTGSDIIYIAGDNIFKVRMIIG